MLAVLLDFENASAPCGMLRAERLVEPSAARYAPHACLEKTKKEKKRDGIPMWSMLIVVGLNIDDRRR